MPDFAERNPLGVPISDLEYAATVAELERLGRFADITQAALRGAVARLAQDGQLMRTSGRWVAGQPDPLEFVPGDVAAIRGMALQRAPSLIEVFRAHTGFTASDSFIRITTRHLESLVVDLTTAMPYFIPSTATHPVLHSRPPPPEVMVGLRLPAKRVFVLFGTDLELTTEDYPWPRDLRDANQEVDDPGHGLGQLILNGGYLSGIVLLADDDGHLQDDLLWVIATHPDPSQPWPASLDRQRNVVRGWHQWADLAPLVDVVAAAVAWGAWQPPDRHLQLPDLPANPADPEKVQGWERAWGKVARRARFLRQERRGALAEVHVIDLEKTAAGTPRPARRADPDRQKRTSPVDHDRIGYWKRVRVGPRNDWEYKHCWIPPVRVHGSGSGEPERLVVRRLPPPPEPRQPQTGRLRWPAPPSAGQPWAARTPLSGPRPGPQLGSDPQYEPDQHSLAPDERHLGQAPQPPAPRSSRLDQPADPRPAPQRPHTHDRGGLMPLDVAPILCPPPARPRSHPDLPDSCGGALIPGASAIEQTSAPRQGPRPYLDPFPSHLSHPEFARDRDGDVGLGVGMEIGHEIE